LEEILNSLEEASIFGVNTFREIVLSRGTPMVRRIIQTGTILGVLQFDAEGFGNDDLIGKKVDVNPEDPIYGLPDKTVHLYKVASKLGKEACKLGKESSYINPCVFRDNNWSNRQVAGIFEAHPAFDSVCRDFDYKFTDELKPTVKHSIVTPAVKIEFPVHSGWRRNQYGAPRATNGTAIVYTPFSITPNPELVEIQEFFNENTPQDYLVSAEHFYNQGARVIKAVRENPNFQKLTQHYVELSKQIDVKQQQEHLAGIR
jgi:hypothetical protein